MEIFVDPSAVTATALFIQSAFTLKAELPVFRLCSCCVRPAWRVASRPVWRWERTRACNHPPHTRVTKHYTTKKNFFDPSRGQCVRALQNFVTLTHKNSDRDLSPGMHAWRLQRVSVVWMRSMQIASFNTKLMPPPPLGLWPPYKKTIWGPLVTFQMSLGLL